MEAPRGGTNIVLGLGLYASGINQRAVAMKWMAGTDSLMNDVRILGGHGTPALDGGRENPYNANHSGDPNRARRWDAQYPSLWVTNGGGGTFFDIWTPSSFAQAGLLVSDTSTEGRIYEMSSEHHVRHEVQFNTRRTGRSTPCKPKANAARAARIYRSKFRTRTTSRSPTSTSIA